MDFYDSIFIKFDYNFQLYFRLTQSGLTENIRNVTNRNMALSTTVEGFEDEKENLINKRESSHEYD